MLHQHLTGELVLHWLTGAVPLAAFLAAVGAVRPARVGFLARLSLVVTGATLQLRSRQRGVRSGWGSTR